MEEAAIKKRFNLLKPFLDERLRRILAATEASALRRKEGSHLKY